MIYFDNAASTKIDLEVLNYAHNLAEHSFANPNSIHTEGRKARKNIDQARIFFAQYLSADIDEIFFTSCASESNNFFLKYFPCDLIITSPSEHSCVLESIKASSKKVHWLSLDQYGFIDKEELEKIIFENSHLKILISLMYVNNELGTIQDLEFLANLKKKFPNLFIHSDCVQALCKIGIDLSKLDIDSISLSAHKIHGPKGVGLIYINKKIKDIFLLKNLALIHGGSQESGFRSGTQNVIGIASFAEALKFSDSRKNDLALLDKYFFDKLAENNFLNLNSPRQRKVPGIFNLYMNNSRLKSEELVLQLDLKGVAVSSGSACSSLKGDSEIISSYVLRACKLPTELCEKSIRVSLSRHNTLVEIDKFFKIMAEISSKFSNT